MCMESEDSCGFNKPYKRTRSSNIEQPGNPTPPMSPQIRMGLYSATTGDKGVPLMPQGRFLNQYLNGLDEQGIPYPTFKLGPLA